VDFVDIIHPNRHPNTLVERFVSVFLKRGDVCAFPAAPLRSVAQEDLTFTGAYRSEGLEACPNPNIFFQPPLAKPREARGQVGETFKDGGDGFGRTSGRG